MSLDQLITNNNDTFTRFAKREVVIEEIFDLVYEYGKAGLMKDPEDKEFRELVRRLLNI